jgi:hypothetical protein
MGQIVAMDGQLEGLLRIVAGGLEVFAHTVRASLSV